MESKQTPDDPLDLKFLATVAREEAGDLSALRLLYNCDDNLNGGSKSDL
jgi:hypothetical protein